MDKWGRLLCANGDHDFELVSKPGEPKVWNCRGCVEQTFEARLISRGDPDWRESLPSDEEYIINPDAGPGMPLIVRVPDETKH